MKFAASLSPGANTLVHSSPLLSFLLCLREMDEVMGFSVCEGWTQTCMRRPVRGPSEREPAHLSVLVTVSPGVFEVLAGALVAVGVQVDGAGSSLSQKLLPDLLRPGCHVL